MASIPVSNRSRRLTELPPSSVSPLSNERATSSKSARSLIKKTDTYTQKQRLQNAKKAIDDPHDISLNVNSETLNEYIKDETGEPYNQYTARYKLLLQIFAVRGVGLGRSENLSKVILNQIRYNNKYSPYTLDMINESLDRPIIPRLEALIPREEVYEEEGTYDEEEVYDEGNKPAEEITDEIIERLLDEYEE